jgi:hypothetical protein
MPANEREDGSVFWRKGALQVDRVEECVEIVADLEAADGEDK